MKIATISETKNQLSALLDRVRGGHSILIVDRDRPVARLEPASDEPTPDGRVARLERAGLLRRGTGQRIAAIVEEGPPRLETKVDAVKLLIEDREDRA